MYFFLNFLRILLLKNWVDFNVLLICLCGLFLMVIYVSSMILLVMVLRWLYLGFGWLVFLILVMVMSVLLIGWIRFWKMVIFDL